MARDLFLYNGRFRTMDPRFPAAEAILIRQGRIVARGATADLRALSRAALPVNLAGRSASPGLEDAHLHLCEHGLALQQLQLVGCHTLEDVQSAVRGAAENSTQHWIHGHGWDHNAWPRPVKPTRHDLDLVSPSQPVALDSKDLHTLWVNSAALRLAGIDCNTPDVAGGEIPRDSAGEPLGIFSERARELIQRVIPAPTPAERLQAARLAISDATRLGLTAVHSCEGPESFAALAQLERAGELPLRVWHMLPVRYLDQALALGLRTGFGSERLRIGHIKLFADGALGSGTAEMLEPYEDAPESRGVAASSTEEMFEAVLRAAEGGLACAIHAIGDAANRRVLGVYARVLRELGSLGLRQRIEHVQLITPEDRRRMSRLGVVASMQPYHCTQDMATAERRWGRRCRDAYAWASLLSAGSHLAFGTDAPVEPLNPLRGLYAAMTRTREAESDEDAWYPEERLSLDQALRAYTWGSAYAGYAERERGMLAPGRQADITVFSDALSDDEPRRLLEMGIDCTIVGGQIAFQR
ncbi:MAG: amidohydrolase [Chloroflexi bacterium]|nr:amidohydrolase [Chloroflexota bacterium]